MNEEREVLHNWEVQQIYVKQKEATISQYVTETIITLRWYLVNNIIDDLKNNLSTEEEQDNREALEMVMAYLGLTHVFSKRLGRVLSRYH
jgi:DNA primase